MRRPGRSEPRPPDAYVRGVPDEVGAHENAPAGEVRSLVRGLNVLIAINERPPATVARLVAETRLPKATVVRILNTLRAQGFIAQDGNGHGYRPLPRVRQLASAMMIDNPFLSEARHLLIEFGQTTKWPSDLLLAEQGAMLIVATNRDVAPIRLDRIEQRRFPLLDSAAGLAYLAALDPAERARVVREAAEAEGEGARLGEVLASVEAVVARGYAVRDYRAPIEGTRVLGLAVRAAGRPIGSVALILLRDAVTEAQVAETLLPAMRSFAGDLGERYTSLANTAGSGAAG